MISVNDAMWLIGFGAVLALVCVVAGVVIHMRWLDRKLAPKKPIVVVQQPQQKQVQ
jgi:hypothetical protein